MANTTEKELSVIELLQSRYFSAVEKRMDAEQGLMNNPALPWKIRRAVWAAVEASYLDALDIIKNNEYQLAKCACCGEPADGPFYCYEHK